MTGIKWKTSIYVKKKRKRTPAQVRMSGTLQKRLDNPKLPEWNSCVNNHSYSLTVNELETRRQQRISKNLVPAQVGLYDTVFKRTYHPHHLPQRGSNNHNYLSVPDPVTSGINDLDDLLLRSEQLLQQSEQLLRSGTLNESLQEVGDRTMGETPSFSEEDAKAKYLQMIDPVADFDAR